ncbi:MAG: hypothetical protein HYV07_12025 [Deltaproteobacteria bacterium]|nr:hypothetical protein [Deltaproteobacteria bacterium]
MRRLSTKLFERGRFGCEAAVLAAVFLGCGGDGGTPKDDLPDSAAMRNFLGLTPGSCFTYSFEESSTRGYATVAISGPNESVVAGAKVYVHDYQRAGLGGGLKTYLDAETGGEVRVRRWTMGAGATVDDRRYDSDPRPLFAKLELTSGEVGYPERSFEVTATPKVPDGTGFVDGTAELHRWVIQSEDEEVSTTDGPLKAIRLGYTRGDQTALYWLVPGYGFAQFTDFENRTHSVCDARICDSAGENCRGPETCIAACPR